MTVPKAQYRRVVLVSTVVITVLTALLLTMWWYIQHDAQTPAPEETGGTLVVPHTPYLKDEEGVLIETGTSTEGDIVLPVEQVLFEYVEVVNGCGPHFEGECLLVRSGPGTDYPVVSRLRNGMVLKVDGKVEREGIAWYKISFDEWLRYPERITSDWYVSAQYVSVLLDEGDKTTWDGISTTSTTSSKSIIVNRTTQKLSAYENNTLFMEIPISTGLELTPTPAGTFTIFKKTPSRYMQGPLPGLIDQQYYDLPGVPWNLYFTHGGAVIHGAYWHNSFGRTYSHGCVNLSPENARTLYTWAELGTQVIVQD